jgi:hypothetical protein
VVNRLLRLEHPANSERVQVTVAQDFTVEYFKSFKIVTNREVKPPYVSVLYPCGSPKPTAADFAKLNQTSAGMSGIGFFEIPLTAVATDDSTAGYALVRPQPLFVSGQGYPFGVIRNVCSM